jgi:pyruvate/2-oxoglutarate dehydrogenase complex dihydrolipoamide acyltransferase (E2) component
MTEFEKQMLDLVKEMKSEMTELKTQNKTLTQGMQAIAKDAQQKNEAYAKEIAKRDEEFAKIYNYLTKNLSYSELKQASWSAISKIITKEDVDILSDNSQVIVNAVEHSEKVLSKKLDNVNGNISLIRK